MPLCARPITVMLCGSLPLYLLQKNLFQLRRTLAGCRWLQLKLVLQAEDPLVMLGAVGRVETKEQRAVHFVLAA